MQTYTAYTAQKQQTATDHITKYGSAMYVYITIFGVDREPFPWPSISLYHQEWHIK